MTTNIVPRIALKRVKTLARMISASVRLVCVSTALTSPRATRSATSAAVRPLAVVLELAITIASDCQVAAVSVSRRCNCQATPGRATATVRCQRASTAR